MTNTTDTSIHESAQANLRQECLISAKHTVRTLVCDLERAFGQKAHDAALALFRSLMEVERLEREVSR